MSKQFSYKDSGVNVQEGNHFTGSIQDMMRATFSKHIIDSPGGFAALCRIPKGYDSPILVSGADGVGTKLKLAIDYNYHEYIGSDLVAMCANDILAYGAEPLFFLDYYATATLDSEFAKTIVESIASACRQINCSLVGGETAEMPGLYKSGDYDLAGFVVGIVEESKALNPKSLIKASDVIIGLPSAGLHANGFSLVRKIITDKLINPTHTHLGSERLIDFLMKPTALYGPSVLPLMKKGLIKGFAHITGGGLSDNIHRIVPNDLIASIDLKSWDMPLIFDWLKSEGNLPIEEMLGVFNCGIGAALVVSSQDAESVLNALSDAFPIGEIIPKSMTQEQEVVYVT